MILFFHFICLIARYIVLNISKTFTKPKILSDVEDISERTSHVCSAENCHKRKLEYPKQPVYESGLLKFFPPVYVQRYETVAYTLQDSDLCGEIRKVVDFGCAELGFFVYLKSIESITEILEVDIDPDILERYSFKAAPLTSDYLMGKRDKPLDVYVLAGNVADYDDYLLNCDAVVAIELVEHLNEEDLKKMPYNIFHKIRPKIAVFTTPNADFNSLLPNITNMRHKDHKFEWSRKEFYTWTQQVISEYPEYYVRFFGIGAGPEGTENLGCCSQMAVFRKLEDTESFVTSREEFESIQNYKLISHYEFPAYVDKRTTTEKIIHEIQYQVPYLKGLEMYYNYETSKSEIPLSLLKEYLPDVLCSEEELIKILNDSGMTVKKQNNDWFLINSDTDSYSSDCNLSDNGLNDDVLVYNSCDQSFEEKWSDEEKLTHIQSGGELHFSKDLSLKVPDLHEEERDCVSLTSHKNMPVFCPENCKCLLSGDDSLQKSSSLEVENRETKKSSFIRSRISYKMSSKETEYMHERRKSIFHVCKPFKKISKSSSLDSCLKNINFKTPKQESFLSLTAGGSFPFHNVSPILYLKKKHWINYSDSSLFSSSFDKAGDSGYPFSFSPRSDDLTPEQVDELFTENEMSRSTSLSSEIDNADVLNRRLHHDVFIDNIPVENGDVANNNRDREGNNVEGLLGQIIPDRAAAERDRNDNYFFPDIQEFPPWLLNLGELALQPVYIPLYESDNDEGVVDEDIDSSSDLNQSLDPEDLDIDF